MLDIFDQPEKWNEIKAMDLNQEVAGRGGFMCDVSPMGAWITSWLLWQLMVFVTFMFLFINCLISLFCIIYFPQNQKTSFLFPTLNLSIPIHYYKYLLTSFYHFLLFKSQFCISNGQYLSLFTLPVFSFNCLHYYMFIHITLIIIPYVIHVNKWNTYIV